MGNRALSPVDNLRMAVTSLRVHRLRSLLTVLGVVIGVASVVVMSAVGAGARELIRDRVASVGSNLIMVVPGVGKREGVYMGSGSVHTLTEGDAEAIQKECRSVRGVAPMYGQVGQAVIGNRNWRTRVSGVSADYFKVREWRVRRGRIFSVKEERAGDKVCVMGSKAFEALAGESYLIGRSLRINGVPFRMVGVLESKGQSYSGEDQDDALFIPLKTAHLRLFGTPFPGELRIILVQARDSELVSQTMAEVETLLTRRHRIGPGREKDFTVRSLTASQQALMRSVEIMTIFLSAIASISLVVGGVGIMNIMLVSVAERIREIGIRLAVGARSKDILIQFLMEAVSLSVAGGIVGSLVGILGAYVAARFSGWPAIIGPAELALAVVVASSVGIISGILPAIKASRLDPIEALRSE